LQYSGGLTIPIVKDNYVYVIDNNSGLNIINAADINNLKMEGRFSDIRGYADIAVKDNYAYVIALGQNVPGPSYSGLKVFDLADKKNPKKVNDIKMGSYLMDIEISGNYLYVLDNGTRLLTIYDISNPANPILTGSVNVGHAPQRLCINNNYAYIGSWEVLTIVDITNKNNPVVNASFNTGGGTESMFVKNNIAYVLDMYTGLNVIDVADSNNPVKKYSLSIPYYDGSCQMTYYKNHLFIPTSANITVVNIQNSLLPNIEKTISTQLSTPASIVQRSYAVSVNDSYIYAGVYGYGLAVFGDK
jgi:hypothetical protein